MGYLHNVKPTMTGGLDQGQMSVSPEAHKEWKDSEGKHKIDAGIKQAPAPLKNRELDNRKKSEKADEPGNKTVATGSHAVPARRQKTHGKVMGAELGKLKKAVPVGPMGGAGKGSGKSAGLK